MTDTESQKLVKKFLATKRIEGRSQKTIDRYSYVIKRMMEYLNMPIKDMDVYSLRLYLAEMEMNGSKDSTLNGIRWIMCSFFGWLYDLIPSYLKGFFPQKFIEALVQNAFDQIASFAKKQLDKAVDNVTNKIEENKEN